MIRIAVEHLYPLRNSTGKPFTDLMDRLIRCSAATVGIPSSSVLDNPRTNYRDGGVDTQVTTATRQSDPWGYFERPSCWQYKAVKLADLTDTKIKEEISGRSKEYVRRLLQEGYAYRMCILDDGSAQDKSRIGDLLGTEIGNVNHDAPVPIVIFASDIAWWVNSLPAIAAELRDLPLTDFLLFEPWKTRERAETKTFVATPESETITANIKTHIDWKNKPNKIGLTIAGDAGVGKSRTVFEAIASNAEVAPLTIYVDDEEKALGLARALANDQNVYGVLVADECSAATAHHLEEILKGTGHRVRFVSIDNTLERTERPELRLNKVSSSSVQLIVDANFASIDPDRRYRYCQFSEGYLRFAVFLCANDELIVSQGNFGELLNNVKSYLSALFDGRGPSDDADYTALKALSLVERCGVLGNLFSELEKLCACLGLDPKSVREKLNRMQKTNGLVGRAGRYFYVTPMPVAMACFQAAWSIWAELAPATFLDGFPADLRSSLLARTARASEEVGRVVNAYFRNWEISRGAQIFNDNAETEQLLLLVRASPDQMVPRLRDLVVQASAEQLGGGRRSLVAEAVEIAAFPNWFGLAEEILFLLALDEGSPDLENYATRSWLELFPISTYVATPFNERLAIILKRIQTGDCKAKLLCAEALGRAIDGQAPGRWANQTYGHRIAPAPWRPTTYDEFNEQIAACLGAVRDLAADSDPTVQEKSATILLASIITLVSHGFVRQAKEGAGDLPASTRPSLRAKLREWALLSGGGEVSAAGDIQCSNNNFLEKWIDELASTDLHDRLIEEVGPDYWERQLEQDAWENRMNKLAKQLLASQTDLEEQLAWLSSPNARSSFAFGTQLGRQDPNVSALERIMRACRSSENPNLARGYFLGAAEAASRQPTSAQSVTIHTKLNEALDLFWADNPTLAFHVMTPCGDYVNSFRRAISAVQQRSIPAGMLRNLATWNGQRRTTPTEARLAAETLLYAARRSEEQAATTGIEFIMFLLMNLQDKEDKLTKLKDVFEDNQLSVIFSLLEEAASGNEFPHSFLQVFGQVLPANPNRGAIVLTRMLKGESYKNLQTALKIFPAVAAICPQAVMDSIGEILLSRQKRPGTLLQKLPLALLPENTVIPWLEKHGVEGARRIAWHLPAPFLTENRPEIHPLTRFLLEKFGDDEEVFNNWAAGTHETGFFTGSIADRIEEQTQIARQFLSSSINPVRRWAKMRIENAERNASSFRLADEELFY